MAPVAASARRALRIALLRRVPKAELDKHGYVCELEDNLLPGITRAALEPEFGAGAGAELEGKMRAPWSSSALAVNSFAPWRDAPEKLTLSGPGGFTAALRFEAQCPNGVSAIPPHLDVLLERGTEIVGVESKCTEFLTTKKTVKVADRYLRLAERGDERASSRWFAALHFADSFRLLDAYQLVKHYLGLAREFKGRPLTLVYIYWEPRNGRDHALFAEHRAELKRLADLVSDDETCRFKSVSYPEHWRELESLDEQPGWLAGHLERLRARYFVDV